MRIKPVCLGMLAVVFAAGAAAVEQPAGGAPGVGVRAEQIVPADAVLYVELSDISRTIERLKACPPGRIYAEEEVKQFIAEPLKKATEFVMRHQQQAGFDFIGAVSALKGQCAVALLGMKTPPQGGKPQPEIAVVLGAKDEARKAIEALIGTLLGRLREIAPGLAVQEYQYGATRVRVLALGEAEAAWAFAGDLAIGAIGRESVEKLLDNLGEKKGEVLAEAAAFSAVRKATGETADLLVYASGSQFFKRFRNTMNPREAEEFRKSGLSDVAGGAYAVTVGKTGFREVAYAYVPKKSGVFRLLDQQPLQLGGLAAVPENAVAYLAVRIDPKKTLDSLLELVGEFEGADEVAEARKEIADFEQMVGVRLQQQLYDALTGEVQGYVAFPEGGGFPDFVIMAELTDEGAAFGRLVNSFVVQLRRNEPDIVAVGSLEYRGRTFHYVKTDERGSPVVPAYCLDEKYFILASSPPSMKRALIALDAEGGLGRSERFLATARNIPREKSLMLYLDTNAAFGFGYSWLQPFLQNRPEDKRTGFDPNLMPLAKTFTRHLAGWVIALGTDTNGVAIESAGPLPILPSLGAAGAGFRLFARPPRGRRPGPRPPRRPPPPPELPEGEGGDIF